MQPHRVLAQLLRPAAGGLYVVSTGRAEQQAVQRKLYDLPPGFDDATLAERHAADLARLAEARVVVLGVPSDVGAGFVRGSNVAPAAVRAAMLEADPAWPARMRSLGVVDVGDVLVVPQLLSDEMLDERQKKATRAAIYPALDEAERAELPVAPLSMAERALDAIFAINPRVAPILMGGDHSVAWPAVSALHRARGRTFAVVQPDAHTDLLSERLGIRMCFATWSYHANELLGRSGRLVQVGIRASRRDRAHWESTLDVRQFWAADVLANEDAALDAIVAHVRSLGVEGVYFSNDIDGTDAYWADATGTPEPGGLRPPFVRALIERLGREVGLVGGDLCEVAPPLEHAVGGRARTMELAATYLRDTIEAVAAGRRAE
jgi:arginase family enzyme